MAALLLFLTKDCCGGRPEICAPLAADRRTAAARPRNAPRMSLQRPVSLHRQFRPLHHRRGDPEQGRRGTLQRLFGRLASQRRGQSACPGSAQAAGLRHQPVPLQALGRVRRAGAPPLDFVITVCDSAAGEVCPVWPGQPMTAHWGMPDPAAVEGTPAEIALAFADTYRMLNNRITAFANLKMSGLDRLSLQKKVADIANDRMMRAAWPPKPWAPRCCWSRWSAPASWPSGWRAETWRSRCWPMPWPPARRWWC